jgi:hypothetical protein
MDQESECGAMMLEPIVSVCIYIGNLWMYFRMTFPMIFKNNNNTTLCGVIGKRKPEIKKSIGKLGPIRGLANQRIEIRVRYISADSYSFGNI